MVAARGQGAADEVIREGFNGLLSPSVDPQELDETITRAIASLGAFDRDDIVADCRLRYGVGALAERYAELITTTAATRSLPQ